MKRKQIEIIIIQGKRSTIPSGMEMEESRFSRIRRPKMAKENLDWRRSFFSETALNGDKGACDDSRFVRFLKKPIWSQVQER